MRDTRSYRVSPRHLPVLRQSLPLVAASQRGDNRRSSGRRGAWPPRWNRSCPSWSRRWATAFHVLFASGGSRLRGRTSEGRRMAVEASPRLAIASVEHRLVGDGKTAVDVSLDLRRNDVRVVGRDLSSAQIISANVRRGILDAALEHIIVSARGASADDFATISSTQAIIEQAATDGIAVEALTSREEVASLHVSDDVKARMQRSLGEGAVLIAPGRMVRFGGAERLAWWRVDSRSGEVLAIMDSGLHQVEWMLQDLTVTLLMTPVIIAFTVTGLAAFYIVASQVAYWLNPELFPDDLAREQRPPVYPDTEWPSPYGDPPFNKSLPSR